MELHGFTSCALTVISKCDLNKKFYNPTTKKVVISERADFDERYFSISKRLISAFFHPPSIEVKNTHSTTLAPVSRLSSTTSKLASTSYYFPPDLDDSDSDNESSSDKSLDHRGNIGIPVPPAVDAVASAPAPVPLDAPSCPPSPVAPPRLPSPIGIGTRLPRYTRKKPRE